MVGFWGEEGLSFSYPIRLPRENFEYEYEFFMIRKEENKDSSRILHGEVKFH